MIRFWAKVDKSTTCWRWTAAKSVDGYGHFRVGDKVVRAHRFAYEQLVGPIPEGLVIDHLCRNRGCVNPDHMEPVTLVENIRRGKGISVQNAAKTCCPEGHPYDLSFGDGRRRCLICRRERTREAMRRYRATQGEAAHAA